MLSLDLLQHLVYFVFISAVIAYATLDGFDLGVGCLHLFARTDYERRLMLNAIGPVWDGNTTWIVIGGGVLFAGFPKAFGILMSGFYTPMMMLIFAFMLRGAAVEFRSKMGKTSWRRTWDFCFFFASALLTMVFGLLLGNLIVGIPLTSEGIIGGLPALLKPYPILVAFFAASLLLMHASIYLLMKLDGPFHERVRGWTNRLILLFLLFWIATTAATFIYNPHMIQPFLTRPWLGIFALLNLATISIIPLAVRKKYDGTAFIASCLCIVFLLILFEIGNYPYIARSSLDAAASLTFANSSVSHTALLVLSIVALSGLPLGAFYGTYIYRTFRGKVRLDSLSY